MPVASGPAGSGTTSAGLKVAGKHRETEYGAVANVLVLLSPVGVEMATAAVETTSRDAAAAQSFADTVGSQRTAAHLFEAVFGVC